MKKNYFTFLYVPTDNTGLKTIRIPRWLVISLFGALGIFMISSAIAVIKYASKIGDTYRVTILEKENEVLRSQLNEFDQEVALLKRQVGQNFDFQRRARLMANMDELNEDVTEVGVGGPNVGYLETVSVLDGETRTRVGGLKEDIEKLVRQAKLQSESYSEIVDRLSQNQKLLNATPSIRPVPYGFVSSRFGRRMDPFTGRTSRHLGLDYSVRLGTPIYATADGVVNYAGKWAEFGKVVELSHGFGYITRYAHTSKILVRKGQRVRRGDVIARVGSSGRSTAAHLHYEVLHNGQKKNPLSYVLTSREIVD